MNFTADTIPHRWDSMTLPIPHLHILRHALGLDRDGRGRKYRNHFCTGEGSSDYPICEELVDRELMGKRVQIGHSQITGWDALYMVTEEGRKVVDLHQPRERKLTRGQQRYRDYLRFDGGMTFIEFLRSPYSKARP